MKLSEGTKDLGLPDYIKFGLELEVENVNYKKITKLVKEKNWRTDKDQSLIDSGVECISPVLSESKSSSVWKEVEEICSLIKDSPNDTKREAYVDNTCGGHIHFDSTIFRENPEIMNNFLRLWAESEELIYKMCNDKNDPIRPGAINTSRTTVLDVIKTATQSPLPEKDELTTKRTLKELIEFSKETSKNFGRNLVNANRKINVILYETLLSRNGMASPISKKIIRQINNGNLKLGKPKSKIYRELLTKNKFTPDRNKGLNLTNLGVKNKNTIEFRLSNGTINPQTIKENVFLYASILNTAVDMTNNPEKIENKLQEFYRTDISEEEKVDSFLNIIINSQEDRKVYRDRWESVKNAPVFQSKGAKNFAQDRFKKNDIQNVAQNVPAIDVKNVFQIISNRMTKNQEKEELAFEH